MVYRDDDDDLIGIISHHLFQTGNVYRSRIVIFYIFSNPGTANIASLQQMVKRDSN